MGRRIRMSEIHSRQARRSKLLKLRKRYTSAKTEGERQKVLAKVGRVAPTMTRDQFLATLKPAAA